MLRTEVKPGQLVSVKRGRKRVGATVVQVPRRGQILVKIDGEPIWVKSAKGLRLAAVQPIGEVRAENPPATILERETPLGEQIDGGAQED